MPLISAWVLRSVLLLAMALLPGPPFAQAAAQTGEAAAAQHGEVGQIDDGGSTIPLVKSAPFSLTLTTEWVQSVPFSLNSVSQQFIKRDQAGRLYKEAWTYTPKGGKIASRMERILLADPVAHTVYSCQVEEHVCEKRTLSSSAASVVSPKSIQLKTSSIRGGTMLHEDLGTGTFAGFPVHEYRDMVTLGTGASRFQWVRRYKHSAELGIDLWLTIDDSTPLIRHMTFTATEISTAEPNAAFFQIPYGYTVADHQSKK